MLWQLADSLVQIAKRLESGITHARHEALAAVSHGGADGAVLGHRLVSETGRVYLWTSDTSIIACLILVDGSQNACALAPA